MMRKDSGPITPLNEARISPEPNSGCWLWTGSITKDGYGKCRPRDKRTVTSAHRVVWESHHGQIPSGTEMDHLCRTRCCVNPAHLEPVSHADNIRRGLAPGATAKRHKSITHCPHGHEYTTENTGLKRDWRVPGRMNRYCRTCVRERGAKARSMQRTRSNGA